MLRRPSDYVEEYTRTEIGEVTVADVKNSCNKFVDLSNDPCKLFAGVTSHFTPFGYQNVVLQNISVGNFATTSSVVGWKVNVKLPVVISKWVDNILPLEYRAYVRVNVLASKFGSAGLVLGVNDQYVQPMNQHRH